MSHGPDGGLPKRIFELVPGVWWPAADEHACRAIGHAYREAAVCARSAAAAGAGAAAQITAENTGRDIDNFAAWWGNVGGSTGQGYLLVLADAADQMAEGIARYADEIEHAKHAVIEELLLVAATIVAATATLWIPVVGEIAGAGAAIACEALVAATAGIESALITTVVGLSTAFPIPLAFEVLAGAVTGGAIGVLADVVVAQPVKMAFGDQAAWHWDAGEVLTSAKAGGLAGGVGAGFGNLLAGAGELAGLEVLATPAGRVMAGVAGNTATGYLLNGEVSAIDVITGAAGALAGNVAAGRIARARITGEPVPIDPPDAALGPVTVETPALLPPRPPEQIDFPRPGPRSGKLNLTLEGDAVGLRAERAWGILDPETGLPVQDVIIHGKPTFFAAATGGEHISPAELAAMISGSPGYLGGPVRLLGCNAGAEGATAAQEVADALGVRVIAADDLTWPETTGYVNIGPTGMQRTGHWVTFFPSPAAGS